MFVRVHIPPNLYRNPPPFFYPFVVHIFCFPSDSSSTIYHHKKRWGIEGDYVGDCFNTRLKRKKIKKKYGYVREEKKG